MRDLKELKWNATAPIETTNDYVKFELFKSYLQIAVDLNTQML